jgi:hypothetical protein
LFDWFRQKCRILLFLRILPRIRCLSSSSTLGRRFGPTTFSRCPTNPFSREKEIEMLTFYSKYLLNSKVGKWRFWVKWKWF